MGINKERYLEYINRKDPFKNALYDKMNSIADTLVKDNYNNNDITGYDFQYSSNNVTVEFYVNDGYSEYTGEFWFPSWYLWSDDWQEHYELNNKSKKLDKERTKIYDKLSKQKKEFKKVIDMLNEKTIKEKQDEIDTLQAQFDLENSRLNELLENKKEFAKKYE